MQHDPEINDAPQLTQPADEAPQDRRARRRPGLLGGLTRRPTRRRGTPIARVALRRIAVPRAALEADD